MKHTFVFLFAALPLLFVSGPAFADADTPKAADNATASAPAPSDSRHPTVPAAPQAASDAPTASQAVEIPAIPAASEPVTAESPPTRLMMPQYTAFCPMRSSRRRPTFVWA